MELEDVAQQYHRPSIIDIKVGFQTWYPGAEEAYIQRCQAKDAATTQAALGFKICGMQVRSRSCCVLTQRPSAACVACPQWHALARYAVTGRLALLLCLWGDTRLCKCARFCYLIIHLHHCRMPKSIHEDRRATSYLHTLGRLCLHAYMCRTAVKAPAGILSCTKQPVHVTQRI